MIWGIPEKILNKSLQNFMVITYNEFGYDTYDTILLIHIPYM